MNNETVFAAFAIASINGQICATTRPDGTIGLPGGKVDPGESPAQCAFREASEEGWNLQAGHADLVHEAVIEGKLVQWFKISGTPIKLSKFKEMGRIQPILVNPAQLVGFGNPEALAAAGARTE